MALNKIQHHFLENQTKNQVLRLREGQIVEGKIEQLYQDDRAKVRIGSSTLIAQIQTALSVGESYYFQVSESNEQIYLQVVQGEGTNRTANLETLMNQLQVRGSKVNRQFLEGLISRGIPFNPAQIHQALDILQQQPNKAESIAILQQMFQEKLPITENVFQALSTFNSNQFTTVLEAVYQRLVQSDTPLNNQELALMKLLQQIVQRPESTNEMMSKQLLQQIKQNPTMVSMYQMLGMFDESLSQDEVIARLETYLQSKQSQHFPQGALQSQSEIQTLFNQTNQQITELLQHEQAIMRTALKAISIYHPLQANALNDQELTALIRMIKQELLPLLPKQMQEHITQLLGSMTLDDQSSLSAMLRVLGNESTFTNLGYDDIMVSLRNQLQGPSNDLLSTQQKQTIVQTAMQIANQHQLNAATTLNQQQLTALIQSVEQDLLPLLPKETSDQLAQLLQRTTLQNQAILLSFLTMVGNQDITRTQMAQEQVSTQQMNQGQQLPVQQQLLGQISHYMESLGLTMEHDFIQALQTAQQDGLQTAAQAESIKSLLLQMIQQGGQQPEQIQQLLNFINGLQLQTLTESNQMLQAQMYIPGNPFALNEDIFMKFESKKTEDGKIDEDYCRIIFMLDLEQLQETIVDMQVQKRIITITIFNDVVSNMVNDPVMIATMKENLNELDYQLSTVDWKPLSKQEESSATKKEYHSAYQNQEGFDLKI